MKQRKSSPTDKKSKLPVERFILPVFMTVPAFFMVVSLYHLTLDVEDLIIVEGEVSAVQLEEERNTKGRIHTNCYVYLRQGRFKVMDDAVFEHSKQAIINSVLPGDHVTLYLRKSPFGLGTANLIYQLEHRGEVLMPLSVMKTNFRLIFIFCSIIVFLLCGVQIYQNLSSRSAV